MLDLSQETEALARRLAAAQRLSVDDAIRQALEERARSAGLALALTGAGRDRQAWKIEDIPEEYIDLIRKAEVPEESRALNSEVPEGWTGR